MLHISMRDRTTWVISLSHASLELSSSIYFSEIVLNSVELVDSPSAWLHVSSPNIKIN